MDLACLDISVFSGFFLSLAGLREKWEKVMATDG